MTERQPHFLKEAREYVDLTDELCRSSELTMEEASTLSSLLNVARNTPLAPAETATLKALAASYLETKIADYRAPDALLAHISPTEPAKTVQVTAEPVTTEITERPQKVEASDAVKELLENLRAHFKVAKLIDLGIKIGMKRAQISAINTGQRKLTAEIAEHMIRAGKLEGDLAVRVRAAVDTR